MFLTFFLKYLFICYFCVCWVFTGAFGLSLVAVRGLLLLRNIGSRPANFPSCDAWAYLLHATWSLPGPGIKPVSLALAGGFLTTVPPGKNKFKNIYLFIWLHRVLAVARGISVAPCEIFHWGTQTLWMCSLGSGAHRLSRCGFWA